MVVERRRVGCCRNPWFLGQPDEREACFPARSKRQDPLGRARLSLLSSGGQFSGMEGSRPPYPLAPIPQLGETRCAGSLAMLPSEGRGDRGSERSQLRGAQALPAV